MIIKTALKTVFPFVSVAGSLARTCVKIYTTKALIRGVKGIIIDSSAPVIKYPLLCWGDLYAFESK